MTNKYSDWQSYFQRRKDPVSRQLGKQTLLEHFWYTTEDNMFVMRLDNDGDFVTEDINPAQTRLLQLPPDTILNQKMENFLGKELATEFQAKYMNCLRRNTPVSYYESYQNPNGEHVYFNTMLIPIVDEGEGTKKIFGLSREVTEVLKAQNELEQLNQQLEQTVISRTQELANSNEKLQKQAFTDQLTNIGNRRYFFENAEQILANIDSDSDSSLLYLDLDYFKAVNDKYGHTVGDQVLIQFAGHLENNIRESDILCRFGGEEFVIFMPLTDKNGALELARKILSSVSDTPITVGDIRVKVTTSIGVSAASSNEKCLDVLIFNADKALYHAKRNGRNRVEQF